MGFFTRLLGIDKRMHQRATNGVDTVKAGLAMYLLPECEANYEKGYAARLTAAVVNEVFSEPPSNEVGHQFINDAENRRNVSLVIERAIKPQENLRNIITEAVRVKCTANFGMIPNLPEAEFRQSYHEPIRKLKRLGLLVQGGEAPNLTTFFVNAGSFASACKADWPAALNRIHHQR